MTAICPLCSSNKQENITFDQIRNAHKDCIKTTEPYLNILVGNSLTPEGRIDRELFSRKITKLQRLTSPRSLCYSSQHDSKGMIRRIKEIEDSFWRINLLAGPSSEREEPQSRFSAK